MSDKGSNTRSIAPIPSRSSKQDDQKRVMHQEPFNPPTVTNPVPTSGAWWQNQQTLPQDSIPSNFAPLRRKDTMLSETSGQVVPVDNQNELGHSHQEEDVIQYPRMKRSSVGSNPTYTQHNLSPHSPTPRDATRAQFMVQNIINYTEQEAFPAPAMVHTYPTSVPVVAGHVSGFNPPGSSGTSGRRDQTFLQHNGEALTKKVCGSCKETACKYPDAFICFAADMQARGMQRQQLVDSLRDEHERLYGKKSSKASKK